MLLRKQGAAPYVKRQCCTRRISGTWRGSPERAVYSLFISWVTEIIWKTGKQIRAKRKYTFLGNPGGGYPGLLEMDELDGWCMKGTDNGGITLSTIHASKGLGNTAGFYLLTSWTVCSRRQRQDPEYEEERRLYVAA